MNLIFLLLSIILFVIIVWASLRRRKTAIARTSPEKVHHLLLRQVRFYQELTRVEQVEFLQRCQDFLNKVAITPVGKIKTSTLDRIYVAAAAVIPIFHHKGWAYNNLNEVLLYPGNFSKDFEQNPATSDVMGMVGDGAMHRTMILSVGALRSGFEQAGKTNTGIHEFVHLLDKADGAVDGVPEAMLPDELVRPWMQYMHRAIQEIRFGDSDINPYAGTNEVEFFAVISEYFFQKPDELKEKHPELWKMLELIYRAQGQ